MCPVELRVHEEVIKTHLVPTNFELGRVPRRILVRRALNMTPRRLVGRHVTVDVKRQLDYCESVRAN